MRFSDAVQRLTGRGPTADQTDSTPGAEESTAAAGPPFEGYDKLDSREVTDALSDHSQVELEAVESYERSNQNREAVLDKLRYMRSSEPVPGYDALSVEQIVELLEGADLKTIKAVRAYERKFADRRDVNDAVSRTFEARRATEPKQAAPAYQSASATAAGNGHIVKAAAKGES